MISYSNIGSKVWKSIASAESASNDNFSKTEIDYLDFQVTQWLKSLPDTLRFIHPSSPEFVQFARDHPADPSGANHSGGRAAYRLRLILYLRANQMRILIYRPVLHSATQMLSQTSRESAQNVVDIAKDTIHVLTHINTTSDLYRTQQMSFNYFLLSALAVLFLAVSHAPAQFADRCRDEFYMALDLVRSLSRDAPVSKRLWRTIRSLKEIGPKLGLYSRSTDMSAGLANGHSHNDENHARSEPQSQPNPPNLNQNQAQNQHHNQQAQHDAHSSAAMAMAGLAGHTVDENAFFANHQPRHVRSGSGNAQALMSPNGMANDLTSLFEAAGGYNTNYLLGSPPNPTPMAAGTANEAGDEFATVTGTTQGDAVAALNAIGHAGGMGMAWGNEEELNRIMRDMF